MKKNLSFFGLLSIFFFLTGCSWFLPYGKVPDSLVNPPGSRAAIDSDQEDILLTSLRMYFSTHGFTGKRKPVLYLSGVPRSFCRKLRNEGILFAEKGVFYHYTLEFSDGKMILRTPNGMPVLQKNCKGKK